MHRILMAGDYKLHEVQGTGSYFLALHAVGAVPSIGFATNEAEADSYAAAFDALLLPGGGDLPGEYFGEENHYAIKVDSPLRDVSDQLLFHAFRKARKRVLGICRGCQVANVFLGGSLHQHLPDAFSPVLWHPQNILGRHRATILPGTLLGKLLDAGDLAVNSSHHQAIHRLGEGLTLAATAPDGVTEAVEGENILLLQWHPEHMGAGMLPIFQWLCGDC